MTTKHVCSKLMETHKCFTVMYLCNTGRVSHPKMLEGSGTSLPRENDAEIVLKLSLKMVHSN